MEEIMTTFAVMGIAGSLLIAASMAWYVTPPPVHSFNASTRNRANEVKP